MTLSTIKYLMSKYITKEKKNKSFHLNYILYYVELLAVT